MDKKVLQEKIYRLRDIVLSADCSNKSKEFMDLGQEVLKEFAILLDLRGTFEIRRNAVLNGLGNVVLHGEGIILYLEKGWSSLEFYCRHVKNHKSYLTSTSHKISWKGDLSVDFLINIFKKAMDDKPTYTISKIYSSHKNQSYHRSY